MTPPTLPEEPPALSHNSPRSLQCPDPLKVLWWLSGEEVRIPVIVKLLRLRAGSDDLERFERRIIREMSVRRASSYENEKILPFIDPETWLASTTRNNSDLRMYIQANPEVTYTRRLELLRDAARGLAYLHNLEPPIVHGSIHPGNILVTDDVRGVLSGFGYLSMRLTGVPTGYTTGSSMHGVSMVGFQSPEWIMGSTSVTPMSDVYGLGGTILSVMTGKDPLYQLRTTPAKLIAIVNHNATPSPEDHPELPESDQLWRLMRKCWDSEPSRRPLARQIIYKINLIMDCESGFTAPFGQTIITTSGEALPDSEESVVQPGVPLPSLPPPIPGSLTKDEYIGSGGYGEVHRGYWTSPEKGRIAVAIKSLKLSKPGPDQAQNDLVLTKRIRRETVIWKAAEHTNILQFYGHQLVDGNPLLVSSWCENGDLWSFLASHPGLTRKERLNLLYGAGKGLSHLHSLDPPICHGDIKPQNIVISDSMEALLCDFGISRIITSPGITEMTTHGEATGTPGFGAKEVLEGSGPTKKGDVYAFGGLILATMSGKRPFHKKRNNNLIIIAISRDETPKPVDYPQIPMTDPLWVLMNKCWDPEPSQRPSMTQVVAELQSAG